MDLLDYIEGEEELHAPDDTVEAILIGGYRLGTQAVTRLFRELRDITKRLATQQWICTHDEPTADAYCQ